MPEQGRTTVDHNTPLRDFLEIPYDQLEEMNLAPSSSGWTACRPT